MNSFETRINIFKTYEKATKKEIRVILFLTRMSRFLFSHTGIFMASALFYYPLPVYVYFKCENPFYVCLIPIGHLIVFLWIIKTSPELEKHHQEFNDQIDALRELYACQ